MVVWLVTWLILMRYNTAKGDVTTPRETHRGVPHRSVTKTTLPKRLPCPARLTQPPTQTANQRRLGRVALRTATRMLQADWSPRASISSSRLGAARADRQPLAGAWQMRFPTGLTAVISIDAYSWLSARAVNAANFTRDIDQLTWVLWVR